MINLSWHARRQDTVLHVPAVHRPTRRKTLTLP
jgi:hypothetical protein